MTDSFSAVQRSDELICALSERRDPPLLDPAVEALLALAAYADAAPRPRLEEVQGRPVRRALRGRRRLGLAIGVALAFSSSGIAAAVTGDPLAPVSFVVKQLSELGQHHGNEDNISHLGGEPLSPPPRADDMPTAVLDKISAQRTDHPQREHDRLVVPPPRSRGVDAVATTKRAPANTSFSADERAEAPQPAAEPDSDEPTSDTPAVSHESSRTMPRPEAPAQPRPAEPRPAEPPAEFAEPRPAEPPAEFAEPRPAEPPAEFADPRPAEPPAEFAEPRPAEPPAEFAEPRPAEPPAEFAEPRPAEPPAESAEPRPAEPQAQSPADPRPAEPRGKVPGQQDGEPPPEVLAADPPAPRHRPAAGPRPQPAPEPRRVVPKPPAADPCAVESPRRTDCVRVRVPTPGEVLPDVTVPGTNTPPQSRQNTLPRQQPAAERSSAAVR